MKKIIYLVLTLLLVSSVIAFPDADLTYVALNTRNSTDNSLFEGTFSVESNIFFVASGGASQFTQTDTVIINNGTFAVKLNNTILDFDNTLFISINISGDLQTPRLQYIPALQCQFALNSTRLGGFTETQIPLSGDVGGTTGGSTVDALTLNTISYTSTIGEGNISAGSAGQVLKTVGGVATWDTDNTGNNNFVSAITVTGNDTKNITLTRSGLSDISALFTDLQGGNPFDQVLNITSDVQFNSVNSTQYHFPGDITFNNVTSHPNNVDSTLCLEMMGQSGQKLPHFCVQAGGDSMFSPMVRTWGVINEEVGFLNNSNRTDCVTYFNTIGEELKIDCNTTTTGADFFVSDDFQVVDEFWLKDSLGDWHFLTRTLSLLDSLFNNILFNKLNGSVSNNELTILSSENLVININKNETILTTNTDAINLTNGTNSSPVRNIITYQTEGNPSLVSSTTHPTVNHANVADIIVGETSNFYAALIDFYNVDEFIKLSEERFFQQGTLYVSGFTPTVVSTEINISRGTMTVIVNKHRSAANVSSSLGYFFQENDGTFVQSIDLDDLDEYSSGEAISNNKYFNVVFGIVHNQLRPSRLMAIISSKPSTEYTSTSNAEVDSANTLNIFPSNELLKGLFVPVARVIMQRTGSTTNTIQTLSNGQLFLDIRGTLGSTGGAAPSPSITDHGDLLGLSDDDHTQYVLVDGSRDISGNINTQQVNSTGLSVDNVLITSWSDVNHTPTVDTNESTRFNTLVGTNCGGTNKMNGVNTTGGVECGVDVDTQYTASGTLLDLAGTVFSINEGSLNDNDICQFETTGSQLQCDLTLDASGECTGSVCGGGHTHPASQVTTGTFGSGNFVFQDNVTAENFKLETDSVNHIITDNSTCIIIRGDTSILNIC